MAMLRPECGIARQLRGLAAGEDLRVDDAEIVGFGGAGARQSMCLRFRQGCERRQGRWQTGRGSCHRLRPSGKGSREAQAKPCANRERRGDSAFDYRSELLRQFCITARVLVLIGYVSTAIRGGYERRPGPYVRLVPNDATYELWVSAEVPTHLAAAKDMVYH